MLGGAICTLSPPRTGKYRIRGFSHDWRQSKPSWLKRALHTDNQYYLLEVTVHLRSCFGLPSVFVGRRSLYHRYGLFLLGGPIMRTILSSWDWSATPNYWWKLPDYRLNQIWLKYWRLLCCRTRFTVHWIGVRQSVEDFWRGQIGSKPFQMWSSKSKPDIYWGFTGAPLVAQNRILINWRTWWPTRDTPFTPTPGASRCFKKSLADGIGSYCSNDGRFEP